MTLTRTVGTYALYFLFSGSLAVILVITLKTKWFKSRTGKNMFALAISIFGVAAIVALQLLDVITDEVGEIGRLIGYFLIALTLWWRAIDMLYYNWHYWAWSKEE